MQFKTLFIRMLKELSEDLNTIKKIQSETKDTVIEIKNSIQGNNSRVDEAENQSAIWKTRKQKNKTKQKTLQLE